MRMRVIAAMGVGISLSGCVAALAAPSLLVSGGTFLGVKAYTKGVVSKADRQMATAQAIDKDLNPGTLKVSGAKVEGNIVRWTAFLPQGQYECSQEQGHISAVCVKDRANSAR